MDITISSQVDKSEVYIAQEKIDIMKNLMQEIRKAMDQLNETVERKWMDANQRGSKESS